MTLSGMAYPVFFRLLHRTGCHFAGLVSVLLCPVPVSAVSGGFFTCCFFGAHPARGGQRFRRRGGNFRMWRKLPQFSVSERFSAFASRCFFRFRPRVLAGLRAVGKRNNAGFTLLFSGKRGQDGFTAGQCLFCKLPFCKSFALSGKLSGRALVPADDSVKAIVRSLPDSLFSGLSGMRPVFR